MTAWGVVPAELLAAWGAGQFFSQETATLVTSQFLHGGWLHLLGNLLYLWIFGNNIEDRLGRVLFVLFYLGGGVIAGLTQTLIDPDSTIPLIGASGAIAATLGAYFVLFPGRAHHDPRLPRLLLPAHRGPGDRRPRLLVRAPAARRHRLARHGGRGGVAFFAHIGGFAQGALVAWLMIVSGRRSRRGEPRGIIRPCRTD